MTWKPIATAPKDRSVILGSTAPHGVTYIGRFRYGNLGEPQQSVLAWRCDSSGRFSHPTHWMEVPGRPKRNDDDKYFSCAVDEDKRRGSWGASPMDNPEYKEAQRQLNKVYRAMIDALPAAVGRTLHPRK